MINLAQGRGKGREDEDYVTCRNAVDFGTVVERCQVCGVVGRGIEAEDGRGWEGVVGLPGGERAERGEELVGVCGIEAVRCGVEC